MKDSSTRPFTLVPWAIGFLLGGGLVLGLTWPMWGVLPGWLKDPAGPAWMQAVGSIAAILIAVAVPAAQHWLSAQTRRREAADRARSLGLLLLPHIKAFAESNNEVWEHEHPDHDVTNHGDNACFLGERTRSALAIPEGIIREVGRLHELAGAAEGIQRAIYNIESARELLTQKEFVLHENALFGDTVEYRTLVFDKKEFYDLLWDALSGITSALNQIESFFKHGSRLAASQET
ncbi:hypothetical protein [Xanthomonas sp. SI]|uniref:hypothetical protein n=1 Tax=Xanthomonas sp. SI TaxID=2724123 RepID=UPI00163A6E1B|nr:hypothetical protein [Xanthomonas sp. SI]QNH11194.1 hypothetical protein HEP75_00612 [Xanthomonas sp. SI]